MSKPFLLSSKYKARLGWPGLAVSAAVLNFLQILLLSICIGIFLLPELGGLNATGQLLYGGLFLVIASSLSAAIGHFTVVWLSNFHLNDRVKAANVICSIGVGAWLLPILGSITPIINHFTNAHAVEIITAACFLNTIFLANPVGQILAMRQLSTSQKRVSTAITREQIEILADLLKATSLEQANLLAADLLCELDGGDSNMTEALTLLPLRLMELNRSQEAESVSTLHLRLVEQTS